MELSLNPCSNGICSLTTSATRLRLLSRQSLNPCSNGICSLITYDYFEGSENAES